MIAAVIPTRHQPPELGELLRQLAADNVRPFVLDSTGLLDPSIPMRWSNA